MSADSVTDRDCINLSELVYQDLGGFQGGILKDHFFDGHKNVKPDIKQKFPEYAESLALFPDYYIPTFKKYTLLEVSGSSSDAYYGAAFQNKITKEIVLANRGTNNVSDVIADIRLGVFGVADQQFRNANEYYLHVAKIAKDPDRKLNCTGIVLTGHSLGGAQAITQFVSFYKPGGLLKGLKTFEAPGMKNVFQNSITSGDEALGFGNAAGLARPPDKTKKFKNDYNSTSSEYKLNNMLHEKYKGIKPQFAFAIIQYGTNIDWIYNALPHIGKTIDPLSTDGSYVHVSKLKYLAEKGIPVDVYHSIATYKIYKLDDNDKIVPGHLDMENFLRFVIALLIELKLDHGEVMDFLKYMYRFGVKSYMNAPANATLARAYMASLRRPAEDAIKFRDQMNRGFEANANKGFLEWCNLLNGTNAAVFVQLHRYSEFLSHLKAGTDEHGFIKDAEEVLHTDFKDAVKITEKSESQKRFELNGKITDFEMKYGVHLREVKSLKEIPCLALFVQNSDELAVLEYFLDYNSDHAKTMWERVVSWDAYTKYEKFCKKHGDFVGREHEMFHLLAGLASEVKSRSY